MASDPPAPGSERSRRPLVLQAQRLQDLTNALAEALTPQDVATSAVRHGLAAMDAKTAAAWVLDESVSVAHLAFAAGSDQRLQERFRDIPLDASIPLPLTDAIKESRPVWITDSAELQRCYPELAALAAGGAQFGSVIAALPLVVGGRAIGALAYTWDSPRELDEDDRVYQLLLAQHCAQALARAELFDAERRARAEAERLRDRADFLAQASALLASNLEIGPTVQSLARLAVPRFADWCVIEVAPEVATMPRVVAHADPAKVALAAEWSRRYPPRASDATGPQNVLRTGVPELYPLITDEMLGRGARDAEHLQVLRQLDMRSAMIVPLAARGRTLGVITFIGAESGMRYGQDELAVASDLAHRAALAIDNARLLTEAQQAARARDEFLTVASHELRNPLNALQLVLLSLQRAVTHRTEIVTPMWVGEKLAKARVQSDRLAALVDKLLDVARLSAGPLQLRLEEIDLATLAREVAESHRHLPGGDHLKLDLASSVRGLWDPLRIEQVITNLLTNALKYGEGRQVDLEVHDRGERALLVVRDRGIGIPHEAQDRIFRRFERGVSEKRFAGFGLGLWITRRAVEASGGTVRVESVPGNGARFEVELPKRPPTSPLDDRQGEA